MFSDPRTLRTQQVLLERVIDAVPPNPAAPRIVLFVTDGSGLVRERRCMPEGGPAMSEDALRRAFGFPGVPVIRVDALDADDARIIAVDYDIDAGEVPAEVAAARLSASPGISALVVRHLLQPDGSLVRCVTAWEQRHGLRPDPDGSGYTPMCRVDEPKLRDALIAGGTFAVRDVLRQPPAQAMTPDLAGEIVATLWPEQVLHLEHSDATVLAGVTVSGRDVDVVLRGDGNIAVVAHDAVPRVDGVSAFQDLRAIRWLLIDTPLGALAADTPSTTIFSRGEAGDRSAPLFAASDAPTVAEALGRGGSAIIHLGTTGARVVVAEPAQPCELPELCAAWYVDGMPDVAAVVCRRIWDARRGSSVPHVTVWRRAHRELVLFDEQGTSSFELIAGVSSRQLWRQIETGAWFTYADILAGDAPEWPEPHRSQALLAITAWKCRAKAAQRLQVHGPDGQRRPGTVLTGVGASETRALNPIRSLVVTDDGHLRAIPEGDAPIRP